MSMSHDASLAEGNLFYLWTALQHLLDLGAYGTWTRSRCRHLRDNESESWSPEQMNTLHTFWVQGLRGRSEVRSRGLGLFSQVPMVASNSR